MRSSFPKTPKPASPVAPGYSEIFFSNVAGKERGSVGLVTPIPTCTLDVALFTPATEPSTRQLEQSTSAFEPIAVELLIVPGPVFDLNPTMVLLLPVELARALYPNAVLFEPLALNM